MRSERFGLRCSKYKIHDNRENLEVRAPVLLGACVYNHTFGASSLFVACDLALWR